MHLVPSDEPMAGGAAVAVTPAVAADPGSCNVVVYTQTTIPEDDSGYTLATIAELRGTAGGDWGFTTWHLHCAVQELGTEPLRLARERGMATRINGTWGTAPRPREQATPPR